MMMRGGSQKDGPLKRASIYMGWGTKTQTGGGTSIRQQPLGELLFYLGETSKMSASNNSARLHTEITKFSHYTHTFNIQKKSLRL